MATAIISIAAFQALTLLAYLAEKENWFGLGRHNFGMAFSMFLFWIPCFIAHSVCKRLHKSNGKGMV